MAQDGVNADDIPLRIGRDHGRGPQRGGVCVCVIAANYLHRKMERETLHHQLDLAHAHAELNRINFMMRSKNGTLL